MKELTEKETIDSVRALDMTLDETKGLLTENQRRALVGAVLKTIGPSDEENGNALPASSQKQKGTQ